MGSQESVASDSSRWFVSVAVTKSDGLLDIVLHNRLMKPTEKGVEISDWIFPDQSRESLEANEDSHCAAKKNRKYVSEMLDTELN
jgi:hypothetical protein